MPTECQQIKYWVGVFSQKGVSKAHAGVVTDDSIQVYSVWAGGEIGNMENILAQNPAFTCRGVSSLQFDLKYQKN